MTEDRWLQVKSLLAQVLDLEESERAPYLDRACAHDPELAERVNTLLGMERTSGAFEKGAQIPTEWYQESAFWIGRQLGAYRLLCELSEGGMGRVFEAVRADGQFDSKVAIKILRADIDTEQGRRRFDAERNILAALNHPAIARIFDGGVVDGLPYFVMEYVDGKPIDEYCRSHALPLRERVQLVIDVCRAVEHAHQQLIVHRDLKPGNILVSDTLGPKLLDFGIAKLLISDADESPDITSYGDIGPFTPSYAAPEQFRGEPVNTATDQYALGCILFLLLTGVLPYDVPVERRWEWMNAVCGEHSPDSPARALERDDAGAAARRQGLGPFDELRRMLHGDLGIIVLKALEKKPSERYPTVGDFRRDLRRWLDGRPITARPATFNYVARKFVKRHRLAMSIAGVVMAGAVAAAVTIAWEAQIANQERARAETRLRDVQKLSEKTIFDYYDSISTLPGSLKVSERMLGDTAKYLDQLSGESGLPVDMRLDLANAYLRLSNAQSDSNHSNLGEVAQGTKSFQKARAIVESVLAEEPHNDAAVESMMRILSRAVNDDSNQSNLDLQRRDTNRLVQLAKEHAARLKDDATAQIEYGDAMQALGMLLGHREHQYDKAIDAARTCQETARSVLRQEAHNATAKKLLASCLTGEGLYLQELNAGIDEPVGKFREAIQIEKGMLGDNPHDTETAINLVGDLYRVGTKLQGLDARKKEGLDALIEAEATISAVVEESPNDHYARFNYVLIAAQLTEEYLANRDTERVKASLEKLDAQAALLLKADSTSIDYRYAAENVKILQIENAWTTQDVAGAQSRMTELRAEFSRLIEGDKFWIVRARGLYDSAAKAMSKAGQFQAALALYKESADFLEKYGKADDAAYFGSKFFLDTGVGKVFKNMAAAEPAGKALVDKKKSKQYYSLSLTDLDNLEKKRPLSEDEQTSRKAIVKYLSQ